MGKFIISEEERKRIIGLYERIGDKLTPESSSSYKAIDTKKTAQFLNNYYKINLPSSTTGNWSDKDYNDYLKKFMEEKGISVWVCKKGDGYCHDDDEGEVTTKEGKKLFELMFPKSGGTVSGTTVQNAQEKINTTNDKYYDYKLSNGKYYYTKKGLNKWVEATGKSLEAIKTKVKF